MFQIASNTNNLITNDNICDFFNLKFDSQLKKQTFISSEKFSKYKDYFISFRKFLTNGYFIIKCPKILNWTSPINEDLQVEKFEYGLQNYDISTKQFPYVLSVKSMGEKNVRRNILFSTINTFSKGNFDIFYIPINSNEIASTIEDYGTAYFIFKLKYPTTKTGKNGRSETYLTAGRTQFIIADSRNNQILYSKLFSEQPPLSNTNPAKK